LHRLLLWEVSLEAQNWTSCKLPTSDAGKWLKDNTTYQEGFTPRLGSILVYSKKNAAGHVVFVESIDKKGNLLVSESGWNSNKRMWTQIIKPHKYKYKIGYKYEGCIYPVENFEQAYYGTLPTQNLKYGSKGTQVKYLQDFLNWCMGSYLAVDGSYGPAVRDIVKKYQKQYGLVVDGMFGPACRKMAATIRF
jgi:surface antigen